MDAKRVWRVVVKVTVSLLCACALYFLWLTLFLEAISVNLVVIQILGWLMAPVITAAGFAVGLAFFEHPSRAEFVRLYAWPLAGCGLGGLLVYWIGPMLIVAGMLTGGMLSAALREWILMKREGD